MATFLNQPLAHRFGVSLRQYIESKAWQELEVSVAWVRRSGTRHLLPSLTDFLRAGGTARFTVGIDIENTSREGLEDLLALPSGAAETYVYHNEAGGTFHPKVYLFSARERARLIVGSNNLTEAGLFTNTEAGLEIDGAVDEPLIAEARMALASWRDPTDGIARKLDSVLLNDLVGEGYVLLERDLRRQRQALVGTAARKRRLARRRLFGAKPVTIPRVPAGRAASSIVGSVLLMRVRRASATERRTQIQIPIRIVGTRFFSGIDEVQSAHDSRKHRIRRAYARGALNTLKLEIPEIDPFDDPVLRLERTPTGIIYQAFDANSLLGSPIMVALRVGRSLQPPQTFLTRPSSPESSTWCRFV